jgi:hypothetical protein
MKLNPFLLIAENIDKDDFYHQTFSSYSEAMNKANEILKKSDFQFCIYNLESKSIDWQDVFSSPCEMLVSTIINCYEKHLTENQPLID